MDYIGFLALKITFISCIVLIYICLKKLLCENEDQRPEIERRLEDYFNNEERRFVLVHPTEM